MLDLTLLIATAMIAVATFSAVIYGYAFIVGRRHFRVATVVALVATVFGLLQLAASLCLGKHGGLNATYSGIFFAVASIAQCAAVLGQRRANPLADVAPPSRRA